MGLPRKGPSSSPNVPFANRATTVNDHGTAPSMQLIGHVGFALALAAIVVSTLDEADGLWFAGIVVPASVLPDLDHHAPYVLHQGIVHTYSVMFLVSVAVGLIAAGVAAAVSHEGDPGSGLTPARPRGAFVLTTGAMLLGTFSHVTLDVLAYRETFTGPPVEPLWPFTDWVPRINLFAPHAPRWNYVFLVLGVALMMGAFGVSRRHTVES